MEESSSSSNNTVYVAGLPPSVDEASLVSHFSPFGDIVQVSLPRERDGRNKGFGFLTFSDHQDALDALDNMHLNTFLNRTLTVSIAKPSAINQQQNSSSGSTRNQAIWHSEEWLKQHAAADQQTSQPQPSEPEQEQDPEQE